MTLEHSWQPLNLLDLAANPPEPPMIGGLVYRAKRVLLSGETESLKTWLALILAKAEMDAGYAVAWADLDAMGAGELLDRLRLLGVSDETISERFLHFEPTETLKNGRLDDVCALLRDRAVRLFVVDAFNPMLNLHGLDPSSTTEVETFWREVAAPITLAGASPTLLDHVVKNAKAGDKYAYGSERKASGANQHIGFRLLSPLSRGGTGSALLSTHKDRGGYLPRPTVGRLVLVSDGERISYGLEADHSRTGDKFRPTVLMERTSRALESCTEPKSQRWIEGKVQGKAPALRTAVAVLVDEGYLSKEKVGRAFELSSARPYRGDDDPVLTNDEEGASPMRPQCVPDLVSVTHEPDASPRPLRSRDADAPPAATASPHAFPGASPNGVPDAFQSMPVSWSDAEEAPPLPDEEADAIAALLEEGS